MEQEKTENPSNSRNNEVLNGISPYKIILPILLGLGVVVFFFSRQYNANDLANFKWSERASIGVLISMGLLAVRHLAYSFRLFLLAGGLFRYWKCVELMFIWEFSACISPTNAGGTAVALAVLMQERLSGAKVAVIIIYKVLLDSIFFLLIFFLLYVNYGFSFIRPNIQSVSDFDFWVYTLAFIYLGMIAYAGVIAYGLFVSPVRIKQILVGITSFPLLRRWKERAAALGDEIMLASKELKQRNMRYHIQAFIVTAFAWSVRFTIIVCLIYSFSPEIPLNKETVGTLFARAAAMYEITLFSPTPGGSGVAEATFGGFFSDYINPTTGIIVAFIWRLITYYPFLFIGVIVVPNWLRKVYAARKLSENS